MGDWLYALKREMPVIRQAPWSFSIMVMIAIGGTWAVSSWLHSGELALLNATIKLQDEQIAALERKVLAPDQLARIRKVLEGAPPATVHVETGSAPDSEAYSAALGSLLSASGWTVRRTQSAGGAVDTVSIMTDKSTDLDTLARALKSGGVSYSVDPSQSAIVVQPSRD